MFKIEKIIKTHLSMNKKETHIYYIISNYLKLLFRLLLLMDSMVEKN